MIAELSNCVVSASCSPNNRLDIIVDMSDEKGVTKVEGRPEEVRVLIVDNDNALAYSMSESLERVGYPVSVATSGSEGVKRIERELYDLSTDPNQLVNRAGSPAYGAVQGQLRSLFLSLRGCVGAACNVAVPPALA